MTRGILLFRLAFAGFVFVGASLLVACGGDGEAGAAGSPTATTEASGPTPTGGGPPIGQPGAGGETPGPPGFPAFDAPPSTQASADGVSVETGIGTYCWTQLCVDKFGVPTRGELTVSRGGTISLAVPAGAPALRSAAADTFQALDSQPLEDGSQIWPYPGAPGDPVEYVINGDIVEVRMDVPPGRYVLAVSMYFEAGDVVYGVLVEVR